jgi:hypothetical protein
VTGRWPIGDELGDGRLQAPAAARNRAPILDVLRRVLPAEGIVLEIGSGSGEHAVFFAAALPGLTWQPTEPDAALRRSIVAWTRVAGAANVRAPLALDVQQPHWPVSAADAVVAINVVHVSPWSAVPALFAGASRVLAAGAPLVLYGPWFRAGEPAAPGNVRFDATLRAHDPTWGVREVGAAADVAATQGLRLYETIEMPANNLVLVFRRA